MAETNRVIKCALSIWWNLSILREDLNSHVSGFRCQEPYLRVAPGTDDLKVTRGYDRSHEVTRDGARQNAEFLLLRPPPYS